jgi:hypothetical protein
VVSAIKEERYGLTHDYSIKRGVTHSEILLPGGSVLASR